MDQIDDRLETITRTVLKRNAGEPEFHQAVLEVMHSLGHVIAKRPDFLDDNLIGRLCEQSTAELVRVAGSPRRASLWYRYAP